MNPCTTDARVFNRGLEAGKLLEHYSQLTN